MEYKIEIKENILGGSPKSGAMEMTITKRIIRSRIIAKSTLKNAEYFLILYKYPATTAIKSPSTLIKIAIGKRGGIPVVNEEM